MTDLHELLIFVKNPNYQGYYAEILRLYRNLARIGIFIDQFVICSDDFWFYYPVNHHLIFSLSQKISLTQNITTRQRSNYLFSFLFLDKFKEPLYNDKALQRIADMCMKHSALQGEATEILAGVDSYYKFGNNKIICS